MEAIIAAHDGKMRMIGSSIDSFVSPPKSNRYDGIACSKRKCRQRNLIECCFNEFKQFRHIVIQDDCIAHNYPAFAKRAAIRLWQRS